MNPPLDIGDVLGQTLRIPTPRMLPVMEYLLQIHRDDMKDIHGVAWSYNPSVVYMLVDSKHACAGRVFDVNGIRVEYRSTV
jgi:hypothetical protein